MFLDETKRNLQFEMFIYFFISSATRAIFPMHLEFPSPCKRCHVHGTVDHQTNYRSIGCWGSNPTCLSHKTSLVSLETKILSFWIPPTPPKPSHFLICLCLLMLTIRNGRVFFSIVKNMGYCKRKRNTRRRFKWNWRKLSISRSTWSMVCTNPV